MVMIVKKSSFLLSAHCLCQRLYTLIPLKVVIEEEKKGYKMSSSSPLLPTHQHSNQKQSTTQKNTQTNHLNQPKQKK